jgi:hypothetical protein
MRRADTSHRRDSVLGGRAKAAPQQSISHLVVDRLRLWTLEMSPMSVASETLALMGKGRRKGASRRAAPAAEAPYDPKRYAPERLYADKVVGQLGASVDGWTPELVYRYAILVPESLCVDWAIMVDVYRLDGSGEVIRRRVERIDICHSEIHVHEFRQSDDPLDDHGRKRVLMSISAGEEVTVDREYGRQLDQLAVDWLDRVRRWIDG